MFEACYIPFGYIIASCKCGDHPNLIGLGDGGSSFEIVFLCVCVCVSIVAGGLRLFLCVVWLYIVLIDIYVCESIHDGHVCMSFVVFVDSVCVVCV